MSNPVSAALADVYGDQTLLFGLPTTILTVIAGMAVTELKSDAEVQFQTEAQGPNSAVTGLAVSQKKKYTGTGSGFLLDYTAFLAVKNFTFNGLTYVITKWGQAYSYKDYAKADFSFVAYDGITVASGGSGS